MALYEGEYTVIEGDFGGGKGGPAPHTPVEASDTLASKQSLKMLFAIAEGEIQSVDEIYINGTPFSAFEGQSHIRYGTLDQAMIPGFEDIGTPFAVSTQLVYNTYITRAVSSSTVDAVRITFKLQGLNQVLSNGDRVGYAVQYQIQTRQTAGAGTWVTAATVTKSGKASSVYAWDVRVNKPAAATGVWEFRIVRLTPADTSKQISITFFDSYTEIQDKKLVYPGTALVGLIFTNADQLGGRIPTVSFDAHGWKMKVPAAAFYNPVTRVYTGVWNGAFDTAYQYTDNPAWFIYNILTTAMNFVTGGKTYYRGLNIADTLIDPFSFYELAKYCDQLVDNGKGGQEPRFTVGNQFYRRENAPNLLAYALTICNANLTNQNGLITIISDRPTASTKLVTNANVIGGAFSYPSSHVDERFTAVNVTFNDPDDKSNTRTISEFATQSLIDRYGFNSTDIVLVGCRSEGQARRKAKWVLEAPTQIVQFGVGLGGAYYNVGEVVEIWDERFTNQAGQGLIAAATTTQITLDRSITFGAQTYTIMAYGDDGVTLQNKVINQQNTTTSVVTMSTALATAPAANTPYIIKGSVIPRPFRISSIERDGDQYNVVGTQYDVTRYTRIEGGVVVTPPGGIFSNVGEFFTEPVTNITFQEIFSNDGVTATARLLVRWDWDLDNSSKFAATFDVIWRRDNLPFNSLPSRQVKEAEIADTTPGVYEVIIYAVNIRGIRSLGVTQVYSYRVTAGTSSLLPPENFWARNTTGAVYNTRNLAVTWTYPLANDLANDVLRDYIIEVWDENGIGRKNSYVVYPNVYRGGDFNYTHEQNVADFGAPTRDVQLKIYSRDVIGDVSVPLARVFTNPVPGVVSFSLLHGVGVAYVSMTPPADPDIAGYIIYRATAPNTPVGQASIAYDGPDTYVSLGGADNTTYYYKIAAYDTFDKSGLVVSGEQFGSTLGFDAITWSKTGINFTPNSPGANQIAWTSGAILKNASTTYNIVAGSASWSSGVLYIYFNPQISATTLQTTTTLATAVAQGNYPLATYEGGTNLKGGDGSAFISGSQIIAGTVGAAQLIAGSAVITGSAQIANGILTNAHAVNLTIDYGQVTDTLQSTNWSTINHTGWRLNKSGGITTHDLTVLDGSGNVVLASGSNINWNAIGNRPSDADLLNTGDNLAPNPDLMVGTANTANGWTRVIAGTPLYALRYSDAPTGNLGPTWNNTQPVFYANLDTVDDTVYWYSSLIDIDWTKVYCLSCYARRFAGTPKVFFGLEFYDANNVMLTYSYNVLSDFVGLTNNYVQYSGLVGPGQAVGFPTNCVKVAIRWFGGYLQIGASMATRFIFNQGTTPSKLVNPLDASVVNKYNRITPGNASTYIENASIQTAHIGLAAIDTLRVAGQAFSFMIGIQINGFNAAVSSASWATAATFTAPIEYVSLISPTFACYLNCISSGGTKGNVAIRIRRLSDNAIVAFSEVGLRNITGVSAPANLELGIGFLNFTGSTNSSTDIQSKTKWPDMFIQGTGNTTAFSYAIEIQCLPVRGPGDFNFLDWQTIAGYADITIQVLKR